MAFTLVALSIGDYMTPIETAICQFIKASGGWPKTDEQHKRCEQALESVCVHGFSVSWHSVTVDSNSVMQQAYKQWEQMNEKV